MRLVERLISFIGDLGALIALDRNDRRVAGLIELGRRAGASLITVAPVVAQAWRDGARQARLARLLPMVEVRGTGLRDVWAAGELLAASGTTDAVDALVTMVAVPGDQLLTSDPADIETLVTHRAITVTVVCL